MIEINEIWLAEFCGLFWGEGCADIQRYSRNGHQLYRPRLRMQLRSDDEQMLREIQEVFGGTMNFVPNTSQRNNSAWQWTLQEKSKIVWVCDNVLLKGRLSAKKKKQIEYVREAAALRAGKLGHTTEGEKTRLYELYEIVRKLKRFE